MATYYVRPTNGSDVAAGTTFGTAFKTTQKALDTATSTDEIRLCNEATETPSATIDADTNSGTATSPILMRAGDSTDGTLLTSGYYTISGSSLPATTHLFNLGVDGLRVERVRFTGATSACVHASLSDQSECCFTYCRFDNAGAEGILSAVKWYNYGLFNLIGCEIDNNTTYGIKGDKLPGMFGCSVHDNGNDGAEGETAEIGIKNCLFYDNAGHGLELTYVRSHSGPSSIVGNTFSNNSTSGLKISWVAMITAIANNVFHNNGAYGFDFNSLDEDYILFCDFNAYYGNTTNPFNGAGGTTPPGSNNVTSDPSFESVVDGSEDYEPGSGSPLIGVGFPGVLPAGGTGYLDIGALQREMAAGGGAAVVSNLEIIT